VDTAAGTVAGDQVIARELVSEKRGFHGHSMRAPHESGMSLG